jgi:hypothetical protein
MFIKKDPRKLNQILSDPGDDRSSLKLARRGPEFHGDTSALLALENASAFRSTKSLSLYNNKLATLSGFSTLVSAGAPLEDLVLSNNELPALPPTLGSLRSLRRLWAEDNALRGALPACVLKLTGLRLLRLSGNAFDEVPDAIAGLTQLEELALDGNALVELPEALGALRKLRVLQLRGNKLTRLPSSVGELAALEVLAVSSNRLEALPPTIGGCVALRALSVNGNGALRTLPAGLARCEKLARVVAANCGIAFLPLACVAAWAPSLPPALVRSAHVLVSRFAAEAAGSGGGGGGGFGCGGFGSAAGAGAGSFSGPLFPGAATLPLPAVLPEDLSVAMWEELHAEAVSARADTAGGDGAAAAEEGGEGGAEAEEEGEGEGGGEDEGEGGAVVLSPAASTRSAAAVAAALSASQPALAMHFMAFAPPARFCGGRAGMHVNLDSNPVAAAAEEAEAGVREAAGELLGRLLEAAAAGRVEVLSESQLSVPLLEEILRSKKRR